MTRASPRPKRLLLRSRASRLAGISKPRSFTKSTKNGTARWSITMKFCCATPTRPLRPKRVNALTRSKNAPKPPANEPLSFSQLRSAPARGLSALPIYKLPLAGPLASTAKNKFRYVVQSAGSAPHAVRAAVRRQLADRRARSDAPYHVSKFVCHNNSVRSSRPGLDRLRRLQTRPHQRTRPPHQLPPSQSVLQSNDGTAPRACGHRRTA